MTNILNRIDYTAIGKRINEARTCSGLTLEQVAEKCGVKQYQTVSKWEKANTLPSLAQLLKLCEIFQCDIDYLLGKIPCKTKTATDIMQETGLSEKSISILNSAAKVIREYSRSPVQQIQDIVVQSEKVLEYVNALITSPDFCRLVSSYHTVQIAKEDYAQWEVTYNRKKAECDDMGLSKKDFERKCYNEMRDVCFESLMDYQHFLDK